MGKDKDKEKIDQEKEVMNETLENDIDANEVKAESKELTPEEKYAELNDRFLRLYAEFENFRRRTSKERVDMIASANSGTLKDLLPILDDFERAIANNANLDDVKVLKEGFTLIYNKFKSSLEAKGLKQMDAKGKPFDADLHEAIANMPVDDASQKGTVIDDVEKGYYLNDKVIRFAKVVVGQ